MDVAIPADLRDLKQHSNAVGLDYLDLIINATLLDYPLLQRLAELDPPPLQALLLEGTPEHALAAQGPIVLRVFWAQSAQVNWLGEFARAFSSPSRILYLLSRWPFDALAEHLRYCTQAQWSNGAKRGILRFYDTRLFKHISGLFMGDAARDFHAPVISWHWMDRDHRSQVIGGHPIKLNEFVRPRSPLMLNAFQVEAIHGWTAAEQWEETYGLHNRNYRVGKEQLITQLYLGQLAADEKQLKGQARQAFVEEWLAQLQPENLPKTGGLA
jgi:hypothetical protein